MVPSDVVLANVTVPSEMSSPVASRLSSCGVDLSKCWLIVNEPKLPVPPVPVGGVPVKQKPVASISCRCSLEVLSPGMSGVSFR